MKCSKFNILFEVISQEIPAKMQQVVANQFFLNFLNLSKNFFIFPKLKNFNFYEINLQNSSEDMFKNLLDKTENNLNIENFDIKIYFSSSRICFKGEIFVFSKIEEKIIKGPPKNQLINDSILEKFLIRSGAYKEEIIFINEKGIEYASVIKKEHFNEEISDVLENLSVICFKTLKETKWPNSLFYEGSGDDSWIRPIQNLLAISQGADNIVRKVDFEYAGIHSSSLTLGHKFLSVKNFNEFKPEKIEISEISNYETLLKQNFVIISHEERMNYLINEARKNAPEFKNYLNQDADFLNEKIFNAASLHIKDLFEELICIADSPNLLVCEIDEEFMSLPRELIEYVMISHQRYCPLITEENILSRKFLVVIDHKEASSEMKAGYEKVLFARLLDAKFFFERFLSFSIEDVMNYKLKSKESEFKDVSIFDLNSRIFEISEKLLSQNQIKSKNFLFQKNIFDASKIDLCFELISEYPALRGLMSLYFWRNHLNSENSMNLFGLPPKDVLEKIESIGKNIYFNAGEVYKRDSLDCEALEARIFGISEKIIRLQYFFFEKNQNPTGSKDPFALKRDAHNLFEMILKNTQNDKLKRKIFNIDLYEIFKTHSSQNEENFCILLKFLFKNLEFFILNFYNQSDVESGFSKKLIGFLIDEIFEYKNNWIINFLENQKFNPLKILDLFIYFSDLKNQIPIIFKDSFKRISQIYLKKYSSKKFLEQEFSDFELKEEKDMFAFIKKIEDLKKSSHKEVYVQEIISHSEEISNLINSFLDNVFIEDEDQRKKEGRIFLIAKLFNLIEFAFPFHKFFEFF